MSEGTALQLQVTFNANNELVVSRINNSLSATVRNLEVLGSAARSSSRAFNAFQFEVNKTAAAINGQLLTGVTAVESVMGRLATTATRAAKYGLAIFTGEVIGATFAARKLVDAFIDVNEQFADLEIVTKSAYKSLSVARELRQELVKLTSQSPIPFPQLSEATRSFSVIPYFRANIASQAAYGSIDDPNGTFRKAIGLAEKMLAFRPDKNIEDAIFAIREAMTGEFRSIIRRFDVSPSVFVTASGKSMQELKQDPRATFDAMDKFFSSVISSQAISELIKQPKYMSGLYKEQALQIPLLKIGDAGFYKKILDYFYVIFEDLTKFISTSFEPIAKRFSSSLSSIFDTLSASGSRITEYFLSKVGLGAKDRPGESVFSRTAEALAKGIEALSDKLPGFIDSLSSTMSKLIPIMETLVSVVTRLVGMLASSFASHPILTVGALAIAPQIAKMTMDYFKSLFVNGVTAGATAGVARVASLPDFSFFSNHGMSMPYTPWYAAIGSAAGLRNDKRYANVAMANAISYNSLYSHYSVDSAFAKGASDEQLSALGLTRAGLRTAGKSAWINPDNAKNILNSASTDASVLFYGSKMPGVAKTAGGVTGFVTALSEAVPSMLAVAAAGAVFAGAALVIGKAADKLSSMIDEANAEAFKKLNPMNAAQVDSAVGQKLRDVDAVTAALTAKGMSPGSVKISSQYADASAYAKSRTLNLFQGLPQVPGSKDVSLSEYADLMKKYGAEYNNLREVLDGKLKSYKSPLTGNEYSNSSWLGARDVSENYFKLISKAVESLKGVDVLGLGSQATGEPVTSERYWPEATKLRVGMIGQALNGKYSLEQILASSRFKGLAHINSQASAALNPENTKVITEIGTFKESLDKENTPFKEALTGSDSLVKSYNALRSAKAAVNSALSANVEGWNSSKSGNAVAAEIETELNKYRAELKDVDLEMFNSEVAKPFDKIIADLRSGSLVKDTLQQAKQNLDAQTWDNAETALNKFQMDLFGVVSKITNDSFGVAAIKLKDARKVYDRYAESVGIPSNEADFQNLLQSLQGQAQSNDFSPDAMARQGRTRAYNRFQMSSFIRSEAGKQTGVDASGFELQRQLDAANLSAIDAQLAASERQARMQRGTAAMSSMFGNPAQFGSAYSNPTAMGMTLTNLSNGMDALRLQIPNDKLMEFNTLLNNAEGIQNIDTLVAKYKAMLPILDDLIAQTQKQYDLAGEENTIEKERLRNQLLTLDAQRQGAARSLTDIQGSGFGSSFNEGFVGTAKVWREEWANMREIGVGTANALRSSLGGLFDDFVFNCKSAGEAFNNFALNLGRTAANMLANKAIEQLLGYVIGSLGSLASPASPLTGNAAVDYTPGTPYLVAATGGPVTGGSGVRDDVPILAMGGEYMLNKQMTQAIGVHNLENWRRNGVRSFANGGPITPVVSSAFPQSAGSPTVNINIDARGDASSASSSSSNDTNRKRKEEMEAMARGIRAVVVTEIQRQQRQGGLLSGTR